MTGSDARKANSSARSLNLGRSKALLAICGALALGLAAGLPATSAQAQYRGFWAPDYDGYPPPIPPRDIGHRHREAWAPPPPYVEEEAPPQMERPAGMERMPIPVSELRHRATLAGLKLLGTPHRRGDVYVGFGEDSHGAIHHLTFNAYEGRIIENEVSTTAAKAAPAKPATPPSAAVAPAKPSTPAATTATAAPTKPATPVKAATVSAKPAAAPAATATAHSASPAQPSSAAVTPSVKASKSKDEPAPSVTAKDDDLSPIKPKPGDHVKPPLPDSEIDKD